MEEAPKGSPEKEVGSFGKLLIRVLSVQFWSVQVPQALDPWAPNLANSFADDVWLAPWPKVAANGPMVAALIGLLTPWLWPWMVESYTESVIFLILAAGSAALNWAFGASLLAGYVLGDIAHVLFRSSFLTLRTLGGHAVGYLLLGILVLRLPQLAARLGSGKRLEIANPALRARVKSALNGAICAGLVLLWCQGTIVLIRPVFTWTGNSPTDEAIMPVQLHWFWIVAASAFAAAARVNLKDFSTSRSPVAPVIAELCKQRAVNAAGQVTPWSQLAGGVRVVLRSVLLTIALAGTYEGWIDPLVVFIVCAAVGLWRDGLLGKVPTEWLQLTARIPALVRIAVVAIIGFVISDVIVSVSWNNTNSLRPVMYGSLLTVVSFYIMFPSQSVTTASSRHERGDLPLGVTTTGDK